jgi:outer membrane protein OmpA-like peptidoglycan-associated protein
MKKIIVLATALAFGTNMAAAATNQSTELKQSGVFFTSAIVGAVAGGPLGFLAGALGGAWMGEEIRDADQLETTQLELASLEKKHATLESEFVAERTRVEQYAQFALEQLQLELLFKTNDTQLTNSGQKRVAFLADWLANHPEINIRLDGYADPRGNNNYNQQLSVQRAESVVQVLLANGVKSSRISVHGHGHSKSKAQSGNYDEYAMERRVSIGLTRADENEFVAQIELKR